MIIKLLNFYLVFLKVLTFISHEHIIKMILSVPKILCYELTLFLFRCILKILIGCFYVAVILV